jgi:molybdate transport system ATP-binding protein
MSLEPESNAAQLPEGFSDPGVVALLCRDGLAREALTRGLRARYPDSFLVSIGELQALVASQDALDDSEYQEGLVFQGLPVGEFLGPALESASALMGDLGLAPLADRGIRFLSNGELRKVLSLAALEGSAPILIIEDPFDGLDASSRAALSRAFQTRRDKAILLLLEHESDIPAYCRAAYVQDGSRLVDMRGSEGEALLRVRAEGDGPWGIRAETCLGSQEAPSSGGEIIMMRDVRLSYDGRLVFSLPLWRVMEGEHWLVQGPNGCGKSSLLGMVSGDNVKAYGQDVRIFGARKGSGESVWELKRSIGYLSRELHQRYRLDCSLLDTVLSGCFDSIGLYEKPTRSQDEAAKGLCACLGWDSRIWSTAFLESSFTRQRLALILRALIKLPRLLILDEPCQGLDDGQRESLLSSLEGLVAQARLTSLYVTHRHEEIPGYVSHRLGFADQGGAYLCSGGPISPGR